MSLRELRQKIQEQMNYARKADSTGAVVAMKIITREIDKEIAECKSRLLELEKEAPQRRSNESYFRIAELRLLLGKDD